MKRSTKLLAGGAVVALLAIGTTGIAAANIDDDDEEPLTGEALEKASTAALVHTGGGRVTETEVGDEDSYYEVEVTLPDGRQVDVQLDQNFQVVGDKDDGSEGEDD